MLRTPRSRLDAVFWLLVQLIELNVGHRGVAVDQRLSVFFSADFNAISSTRESVKTVPIIEKIQLMFHLSENWSDKPPFLPFTLAECYLTLMEFLHQSLSPEMLM